MALKIEHLSLKTSVKGTKIATHRYQYDRMFELPFYGVSYTYDEPIKFKNFNLSTSIFFLVKNPMEEKKLTATKKIFYVGC